MPGNTPSGFMRGVNGKIEIVDAEARHKVQELTNDIGDIADEINGKIEIVDAEAKHKFQELTNDIGDIADEINAVDESLNETNDIITLNRKDFDRLLTKVNGLMRKVGALSAGLSRRIIRDDLFNSYVRLNDDDVVDLMDKWSQVYQDYGTGVHVIDSNSEDGFLPTTQTVVKDDGTSVKYNLPCCIATIGDSMKYRTQFLLPYDYLGSNIKTGYRSHQSWQVWMRSRNAAGGVEEWHCLNGVRASKCKWRSEYEGG